MHPSKPEKYVEDVCNMTVACWDLFVTQLNITHASGQGEPGLRSSLGASVGLVYTDRSENRALGWLGCFPQSRVKLHTGNKLSPTCLPALHQHRKQDFIQTLIERLLKQRPL